MNWTSEKPTVPGWWWHLCEGLEQAIIVFVSEGLFIEQGAWHVSELSGSWAGPLLPPGGEDE